MKKLFALMLALCLMVGCTALAENEISWEDVAPQVEAAGIEGEFVTFDQIAAKVFIPAGMEAAELPDESYIGYFASSDGDAVAIQYVNVEGMELEQYKATLAETEGVSEIEAGTVNGLPCLTYAYNNCQCLAFATQAGYILEVTVGPLPDDNAKMGAAVILASVQAAE